MNLDKINFYLVDEKKEIIWKYDDNEERIEYDYKIGDIGLAILK